MPGYCHRVTLQRPKTPLARLSIPKMILHRQQFAAGGGLFFDGILIGSSQAFALNGRMWLPDIQKSGKRNCP